MIELAVIGVIAILALTTAVLVLVHAQVKERQEVRAERADLLLRLSETQQQTVLRHHLTDGPQFAPPAIDAEIDEDFWVSKDDLAELAAREETD